MSTAREQQGESSRSLRNRSHPSSRNEDGPSTSSSTLVNDKDPNSAQQRPQQSRSDSDNHARNTEGAERHQPWNTPSRTLPPVRGTMGALGKPSFRLAEQIESPRRSPFSSNSTLVDPQQQSVRSEYELIPERASPKRKNHFSSGCNYEDHLRHCSP
jgi:hypothetical protein